MIIINLLTIRENLEKAWSFDTTYCPEDYDYHDQSWGQCAVSAVLIQDILKGEIMKGIAKMPNGTETVHYWNKIMGLDIDLTWRQFKVGTVLRDIKYADRDEILNNDWTKERYEKLKQSFSSSEER